MKTFKEFLLETDIDFDSLKTKYSMKLNKHRIDVFNSNGAVGYIEWDADDGEIEDIHVGKPYRRQGVGTHLWELAVEWSKENDALEPEHSSRRSKAGDAFARSIGGHLPDLTDDIDGWASR